MNDIPLLSRHRGALLGIAAGDAVGTTLEFSPPGTFEPIDDIIGGGPFKLAPGEWTDDTSMALCLAESLIERGGFDAFDQMQRYLRWYQHGHLSSRDRCFDIGNTVRTALHEFEARVWRGLSGDDAAYCGSTHQRAAGNGSLMRIAPIALYYFPSPPRGEGPGVRGRDYARIAKYAALSSQTTHANTEAVDACRYFAVVIALALDGASKEQILDYSEVSGAFIEHPLTESIAAIARGSYRTKVAPRSASRRPDEVRGTGYVVDSLEAALWAFHTTETFRDAILAAANLGDDADTTAAITGQLAGAFYGADAIPAQWRTRVARLELIEPYAARLYPEAENPSPQRGEGLG